MDMIKQAAEQLAAAAVQTMNLPQMQKPQGSQEGKDFDHMVRQKYQESAKTGEGRENRKTTGETDARAEQDKPEEEQSVEARQTLAAAMMLQRPVIPVQEPVQMPETEQAAVMLPEEQTVQAAATQPVQLQAEETAIPGEEVRPETKLQTAEMQPAPEQLPDGEVPEAKGETRRPEQPVVEEQTLRTGEQPAQPQRKDKVEQTVQWTDSGEKTDRPEEEEQKTVETPLFEQVEAVPVRVAASPAKPVEVNAPDAPEQLAERIAVAEQAGLTRVELTLTPENLGRLTVEITRTDSGVLSVVLNAADPRAAAALEKHSGNLQQLLATNTHSEVRVEVRENQETQQQFLNPDDGQGRQNRQQEQRRQERHSQTSAQDFVHQLRLGLTGLEEEN